MKSLKILIGISLIVLLQTISMETKAFPGNGEDHSQQDEEHDQGNAPGDPGGGGAPVGPIDGGLGILLAGGAAIYLYRKKKQSRNK